MIRAISKQRQEAVQFSMTRQYSVPFVMPDLRSNRRCVSLRCNEETKESTCERGAQSEVAAGGPAHDAPAAAGSTEADEWSASMDDEEELGGDEVAATCTAGAGPALILGMGTATPERAVSMKTYASNLGRNLGFAPADIQFAERICQNSQISTKYLAVPFERYREEGGSSCPSWDVRLGWYEEEALGLAEAAARRALDSWRGPRRHITHLLLYSTSGALSPGLDLRLLKRLGLPRGTRHFAVTFHGCHAGVLGLRTAAEIASGAPTYLCGGRRGHARPACVLVVWVEVNSCHAAPPEPGDPANNVVVASIFGDGAAAAVVGAAQSPLAATDVVVESPALFEIRRCSSSFIDGSEDGIVARVRQAGLQVGLSKQVPELVARHAGEFARHLLSQVKGLTADTVNWAIHPGGRAIIDAVQQSCGLHAHQLRHSRAILDQYSNMGAPTIIFVLQLLLQECEHADIINVWTLALAFGPGISIEGALLRRL